MCAEEWCRAEAESGAFVLLHLICQSLKSQKGRRGSARTDGRTCQREACLLVCVIVLAWLALKEKRFLYLVPRRWGEKGGWKEVGKRESLSETAAGWKTQSKKERKNSGWRAYTVQGVRRGAVIKRLQKTARGAREGAIKARRERRVNYWTPYLAAACEAICTPGAPRTHLNSAR